jgi:hypothetical protein
MFENLLKGYSDIKFLGLNDFEKVIEPDEN